MIMMNKQLLTIGEVSKQLGRVSHTIRQWERDGRLPKRLLPGRDENGWRVWSQDQVEELKVWMEKEDMRPGKALPYNKNV
jgi:DNA-binding transcriptional MerR regulator